MISILAQERLLGLTLGTVFVGTLVFVQRRGIYDSIADEKSVQFEIYEQEQSIPKKNFSSGFAHAWNKAVDGSLGQLVGFLSSRRM